jgi:hypothetical protein
LVVTTTEEPLAIRPPGWARALGPVLLVLWLSVFLVRPARDDFLVPGLVIAVLVVAVVGRMLMSSVIGTADGRLTVRNRWTTRTFVRDEIDGVEVDRAGDGPGRGWVVWLRLADGDRHPLDVTEAPFLGPSSAALERQADAIRVWLDGGTPVLR